MKSILSLIVLAMAVLVMGCGEPASTATDAVSATPDAAASCSCCSECTECEDGKKCECTAKEGEACDCKCAAKEGEAKASMDDKKEEGSDHKEGDGHDHM